MRVSVVVPAYNEEKMLGHCLMALKRQTVPCEIIVCDNNSTDSTVKIARRYADKVVNEKMQGASHAINRGLKMSRGELVAVTGADCVVPEHWLESFVSRFSDPDVISCYGPVHPIGGKHASYYRMRNTAERLCLRFGLWFVILGANCMHRKDILEKVGYYDSEIELFEENGYVKKTRGLGRIEYVPDNGILTSTRREDSVGGISIAKLALREMFKLTFFNRTDTEGFRPVR